ncbi:MAG: hypothetical protein Q8P59_14630, partial [Dehalococcoidia bacterium]|nr:hypothetical protein [Dehalococcoidia bacterium]
VNWKQGQDQGRRIALEKAERLSTIISHIPWPTKALETNGRDICKALKPVESALNAQDQGAVAQAFSKITSVMHDMTHAFYDDWFISVKGITGDVVVHAIYADEAANLGGLRGMIGNWEKGQDLGRKIAIEKVDRLHVLANYITWPTADLAASNRSMAEPLSGVTRGLTDKDLKATKDALAKVSNVFHDLTHAFYDHWFTSIKWAANPDVVYVSWVDLIANFNDLRSLMGNWEQGQDLGRIIAIEKIDRLNILNNHLAWPKELTNPLVEIAKSLPPLQEELKAKNLVQAKKCLTTVSEGFHPLTHAFYDTLKPAKAK